MPTIIFAGGAFTLLDDDGAVLSHIGSPRMVTVTSEPRAVRVTRRSGTLAVAHESRDLYVRAEPRRITVQP